MSNLFKLDSNDFLKGAVVAVLTGAIFSVVGFLQQPGFDVFTAEWNLILSAAVNAGIAAFAGYMSKNLLTDSEGKMLGKF